MEAPPTRYRSAVRARDYYRRQTTWASFLLDLGWANQGLPKTGYTGRGIPVKSFLHLFYERIFIWLTPKRRKRGY